MENKYFYFIFLFLQIIAGNSFRNEFNCRHNMDCESHFYVMEERKWIWTASDREGDSTLKETTSNRYLYGCGFDERIGDDKYDLPNN